MLRRSTHGFSDGYSAPTGLLYQVSGYTRTQEKWRKDYQKKVFFSSSGKKHFSVSYV